MAIRGWSNSSEPSSIDKVKQRLRSYRTLVSKLDACTDLFERLYPSITQQFNSDPVQSSNGNSNENRTHDLIDMKMQMAKSLQAMRDEIGEIMALIGGLPADEYVVILRRYTLNESMECISERTFISVRQCWSIHGSAIERLAERGV